MTPYESNQEVMMAIILDKDWGIHQQGKTFPDAEGWHELLVQRGFASWVKPEKPLKNQPKKSHKKETEPCGE